MYYMTDIIKVTLKVRKKQNNSKKKKCIMIKWDHDIQTTKTKMLSRIAHLLARW